MRRRGHRGIGNAFDATRRRRGIIFIPDCPGIGIGASRQDKGHGEHGNKRGWKKTGSHGLVRSIFRALNKKTPKCQRSALPEAKIPLATKGNPFSFPLYDRYRRYAIDRNLQSKLGGFFRKKKL